VELTLPPDGGAMGPIFGFDTAATTLCANGHNHTKRQLTLIQSMEYPPRHEFTPEGRLKSDGRRPTFAGLLQSSMCQSTRTKAWCSDCGDFRQLAQSKVRCNQQDWAASRSGFVAVAALSAAGCCCCWCCCCCCCCCCCF
jgi:hypothetical protein